MYAVLAGGPYIRDVRQSKGVTAALASVLVLGASLVTASWVVQSTVLDPATYTRALADARAYDRVYTEILADPEMADLLDGMLGGLAGEAEDDSTVAATQARAKVTAFARWTLPPDRLQRGTEALIEQLLAYVNGDVDDLALQVDTEEMLDRADDTAIRAARYFLADAADAVATELPTYQDAIARFADELAAGSIPDSVPKAGGTTFDPDDVIAAIVGLNPDMDAETRLMVESLVLSGDDRDALITVATTRIAESASAAADRLREQTDEEFRYDVVAALAETSGRAQDQVASRLDPVRTAATLLGWPTLVLGLLLVAGALIGIVRTYAVDRRQGVLLVGVALVGTGIVLLVGWWLVRLVVGDPLGPMLGEGDDSWGLPSGLRAVLGDVSDSITSSVVSAVRLAALGLFGVGAVLTAAAALSQGARLPWLTTRRVAVAAGVLCAAIVVTVVVGADRQASAADQACNGHVELCDRAYDDVVYGATHNAMSSPDVVAVWPEHDGDLRTQLDDGIRALLIDTHYWNAVVSEEAVRGLDPFITPELAKRLWESVDGLRESHPGTYLCHAHCGFGSMRFVDGLTSVREFLEDNPREVVTLVIEDGITPEDTAAAMTEAGLDPYLYERSAGDDWPTLGAMIDDGRRLVVLAENEGSQPGWYLPAFDLMQETPFLALSADALVCDENRGPPDASLFQMNHWVQRVAPDRADSARINTAEFLVDRARRCAEERGHLANFLAVNFHDLGDVTGAVDILNGFEP